MQFTCLMDIENDINNNNKVIAPSVIYNNRMNKTFVLEKCCSNGIAV